MTYIKDWFLNKNLTANERYVVEMAQVNDELTVMKETEKAVQFQAVSDFGTIKFWCPKSCIMTEGEVVKVVEEKNAKISAGLNYNETLLKLAKDNKVKGVRKGMKTVTLAAKLREAGVEVPER